MGLLLTRMWGLKGYVILAVIFPAGVTPHTCVGVEREHLIPVTPGKMFFLISAMPI